MTSDDLPTPDEPSAATVRPAAKYGRSASVPSPVTFETACTGTPIATDSTSRARLDVVAEIRLREDDDGLGAALPAERQVPLEPADVQVAVEARGQEDDVDVRGDDLLDRLAVVVGRHPRELRPPRQHGLDHGGLGRRDGHPVADRGQVAALVGRMAKPAGELGRAVPRRAV